MRINSFMFCSFLMLLFNSTWGGPDMSIVGHQTLKQILGNYEHDFNEINAIFNQIRTALNVVKSNFYWYYFYKNNYVAGILMNKDTFNPVANPSNPITSLVYIVTREVRGLVNEIENDYYLSTDCGKTFNIVDKELGIPLKAIQVILEPNTGRSIPFGAKLEVTKSGVDKITIVNKTDKNTGKFFIDPSLGKVTIMHPTKNLPVNLIIDKVAKSGTTITVKNIPSGTKDPTTGETIPTLSVKDFKDLGYNGLVYVGLENGGFFEKESDLPNHVKLRNNNNNNVKVYTNPYSRNKRYVISSIDGKHPLIGSNYWLSDEENADTFSCLVKSIDGSYKIDTSVSKLKLEQDLSSPENVILKKVV